MDPLVTAGPDSVTWIDFFMQNGALIGFILFSILELLSSSGNKSIAAVNEIRKGENIPPETAKIMAIKLFKRYLPFIPDSLAAWFIEFLFQRMKKMIK
jgi:hypothetical protein